MGSTAASHPNLVLLRTTPGCEQSDKATEGHPDSFFDPRASNKSRSERQQPKLTYASLILGCECVQVNRNAWEIGTVIVTPPIFALRN